MANFNCAHFGHQVITEMANDAGVNPQQITAAPVTLDGDDIANPEHWRGLQYIYQTSQKPSTRMQIVFAHDSLRVLPIQSAMLRETEALSPGQLRMRYISEFDTHPDFRVKAQLLHLLTHLERAGFEERAMSFVYEMQELSEANAFAGLSGFFFPLLHFYHPKLECTVVVRTEPVVDLHTAAD